MNAATKSRVLEVLGRNAELPDYPVVREMTKFIAAGGGVNDNSWSYSSDDIRLALSAAWDIARAHESPAFVWDLRGDGAEFDSEAEPQLIAVVGVFYVGGE